MKDDWTDRLSEYVDGDLSPAETRELASHLEGCAACAAAVEELRDVVARARGLRELDAAIGAGSDLWPGIEARIRDLPVSTVRPLPERSGGESWWSRALFNVPQLALACLAVAAVSVAIFEFPGGPDGRGFFDRKAAAPRGVSVVPASSEAARAALSEIDDLKKILDSRGDRLDPETLRALEESVKSMEQAVREASRALDADPGNPYLEAHLDELKERHLDLLRRAVSLAGGAE
ncbi:MAG TPA: zf-HC2 domain-containing protein [Candidatus Eisenbacteria bacterium]|nr:zf-HC2 domain-containing protein [Candidatus Eisenbacteria bacterium]